MERGFRESFCFLYLQPPYLVEQNKPFGLEQTKQHSSSSSAGSANFAIHPLALPPPSGETPAVLRVGDASLGAEAIGCAVVGVTQACGKGTGWVREATPYCAVSP